MIPKNIHQIWIQGENKIPNNLKKRQSSWSIKNPDLKYRLWDHKSILKLFNKYPCRYTRLYLFFIDIKLWAVASDIARYLILYQAT